MTLQLSGFTFVKNATKLDFPLEASLRSLLPAVDELVVNVGHSEDDTLARVYSLGDSRIRVIESEWDHSRGHAVLADETARAMAACRYPWGIYVQADEVLADGGAERIREVITQHDSDPRVEGVVVDYRHFYGGFDHVAMNRSWYRRECRAVRLDPELGIHSFRDAQGFRVGDGDRRIRCLRSGAVMHHYGWARPAWALHAKREVDRSIYPWREGLDPARPLLPWVPGLRRFTDEHPTPVREWIAERRQDASLVETGGMVPSQLRHVISGAIEDLTGWRMFEYRNYTLVS